MPKPRDFIPRTLSAKISLQTVSYITLLLIVTLLVMSYRTRTILREETGRQVNQTLEGIAYKIDNTLLGVEQTGAIVYGELLNHLDRPWRLYDFCQSIIEANPNIYGCAVALDPDYYTDQGKPFMAYVHRADGDGDPDYVRSGSFTAVPFTEQEWFRKPMEKGLPQWTGPLKNDRTETCAVISFDIPVIVDGLAVGVMGVDVDLSVLTRTAQNFKTSTNSYITLLNREGSFIVHPDSTLLLHADSLPDLKDAEDPAIAETLLAMVAGGSGNREFTVDGVDYYMAFMPFRQTAAPGRPASDLGWSVSAIYPKDELFDAYDSRFYILGATVIASIFLLFAGCIIVTRRSLKRLRRLTGITQSIVRGNYDIPDFDTNQTDDVGRLQANFIKMMQALAGHEERLQDLSMNLEERRKVLDDTYAKTKEIERLKSIFFSNMTHQMTDAASDIQDCVDNLSESVVEMDAQQMRDVLGRIENRGIRITEILNDMLNAKS